MARTMRNDIDHLLAEGQRQAAQDVLAAHLADRNPRASQPAVYHPKLAERLVHDTNRLLSRSDGEASASRPGLGRRRSAQRQVSAIEDIRRASQLYNRVLTSLRHHDIERTSNRFIGGLLTTPRDTVPDPAACDTLFAAANLFALRGRPDLCARGMEVLAQAMRTAWGDKQTSAYLRSWRAPSGAPSPLDAVSILDWATARQSSEFDEESPDRKMQQSVLGLVQRLSDGDAIVFTLRAWYPDFMHRLGQRMHRTGKQRMDGGPLPSDSIPHGALVKILVKSYASAGDVRSAHRVTRFWVIAAHGTEWAKDAAPHLALLAALARQKSTKRLPGRDIRTIALGVLHDIEAANPLLDSFAVGGLLELRLRCRRLFARSRPKKTWKHMRRIFNWSLQSWLLHRRPQRSLSFPGTATILWQPCEVQPWRIRPDARSFSLMFDALRSALAATNGIAMQNRRDAQPSASRDTSSQTPVWLRPHPLAHRHLFAQLVVLQRYVLSLAARLRSPLDLTVDRSFTCPSFYDVETPDNLAKAFECFLIARDFAGAAVVLARFDATRAAPGETLYATARRILANDEGVMHLSRSANAAGTAEADQGSERSLDSLRALLRTCEPIRSEEWWRSEQDAVLDEIRLEAERVTSAAVGPTYSRETLSLLRKQASTRILRLLQAGLTLDEMERPRH